MNVTSENDQFQVLLESAATCTASTRSDEIPEKFHPPCKHIYKNIYKFPKRKFGTFFSKSVIVIIAN